MFATIRDNTTTNCFSDINLGKAPHEQGKQSGSEEKQNHLNDIGSFNLDLTLKGETQYCTAFSLFVT